ncbi:MAG: RimK family alpha-L-glutamate ligase [DPANN group archaeon]|nr:RimK family alpha-L-glutamate ligase [DPANN group archaeon]
MKAAIISQGSTSSQWTAKAMSKYFDEVDEVSINRIEINLGGKDTEVLYEGKPLPDYDCIYAKGSFRYGPLSRALTAALCKKSYMPIKASAFTIGHDKLLTQLKLDQFKIATPRTYLSASIEAGKKILEKINYPIVMKFPDGTQGKGVMFADSLSSASSFLDALTVLKQPFIIQEYVDTDGVDIRVIVVGDRCVASMKRKAVKGEKRSNIHAGGTGEPFVIDEKLRKISLATAKALGAEICAVDIMEGAKGYLVIEVNLSPGLQGITKVTKIDVADRIAQFLAAKTKALKEGSKEEDTKKILEEVGIDKDGSFKEVITNLDFRGPRILLPAEVSRVMKLNEKDEVILKAERGRLEIRKMDIGE